MPDDSQVPERRGEAFELDERLTVIGRKLRLGGLTMTTASIAGCRKEEFTGVAGIHTQDQAVTERIGWRQRANCARHTSSAQNSDPALAGRG